MSPKFSTPILSTPPSHSIEGKKGKRLCVWCCAVKEVTHPLSLPSLSPCDLGNCYAETSFLTNSHAGDTERTVGSRVSSRQAARNANHSPVTRTRTFYSASLSSSHLEPGQLCPFLFLPPRLVLTSLCKGRGRWYSYWLISL